MSRTREKSSPRLLPRAVTVRIYRALLENQASFFGAQMTAMDNATRNAGDMVKKIRLRYNRTRQAMITKDDARSSGRRACDPDLTGFHSARNRRIRSRRRMVNIPNATGRITQVISSRRRRQVRQLPAADPRRAQDNQQRQPPRARSRPAARREHPVRCIAMDISARALCAARRSPTPASRSRCRFARARSGAS